MACSTCDGYEFVPDPDDPNGPKVDCPDCRAGVTVVRCPVHGVRLVDGRCRCCTANARVGTEKLLARARAAAAETQRSVVA